MRSVSKSEKNDPKSSAFTSSQYTNKRQEKVGNKSVSTSVPPNDDTINTNNNMEASGFFFEFLKNF
jgi:hypothetical protein